MLATAAVFCRYCRRPLVPGRSGRRPSLHAWPRLPHSSRAPPGGASGAQAWDPLSHVTVPAVAAARAVAVAAAAALPLDQGQVWTLMRRGLRHSRHLPQGLRVSGACTAATAGCWVRWTVGMSECGMSSGRRYTQCEFRKLCSGERRVLGSAGQWVGWVSERTQEKIERVYSMAGAGVWGGRVNTSP